MKDRSELYSIFKSFYNEIKTQFNVSLCLHKALYSLKQSPRDKFRKFSNAIQRFGMRRCQADHSIFFIMTKRGRTLLIVYVNGIIITSDDTYAIVELKTYLQGHVHT